MKVLFYSCSKSSQESNAFVRISAPLGYAGIELVNAFEEGYSFEEALKKAEVVIIQKEFPSKWKEYSEIVKIARKNRVPIVYEIDDFIFSIEKNEINFLKNHISPLLPSFQAITDADYIIVSSPKLRQVLSSFNPNVELLKNYFVDAVWKFKTPSKKKPSDVLTIGFLGTNSHKSNLEFISSVLLDLLERYSQRIRLHFFGVAPPDVLNTHPQVQWTPDYFNPYDDFAAFFESQQADIFISPLVDNLYNRCRNPLKFFEYSALGAVGVYSRIEPYEAVITHRQNGLLSSSLTEWQNNLIELIENDEFRCQLATNAQETIKKKWLLSRNAFRWKDAFLRFLDIPAESKQDTPLQNILQNINDINCLSSQSVKAKIEHCERKIRTLEGLLYQLKSSQPTQKQISELEQEILNYSLSKSWRFTRPIRKIARKISIGFRGFNVK